MQALAFDTTTCEGDVVYSGGCLLGEGQDLETEALLCLGLDAPAQEGDVLPDGAQRRGFWADAFESDGTVTGSRCWLLEDATASAETAERWKAYAAETLEPRLLKTRRVRAIEYQTEVGDEAVEGVVLITKLNGQQVSLGPFQVT